MRRDAVPGWLPSPTVLFVVAYVVVITVLNVAKGFVDVDGFWHLATGRLIVTSGSVPSTDPFTFTWFGQPWIPHEWLSEVGMYLAWTRLGPNTTFWLLGFVPAIIFGTLVVFLRRRGLRLPAVALPAALCGLVLLPYVTFRPQSLSWILLSFLLVALIGARPNRRWWLVALLPAFVLWANLHGFYVVGLGVLAVYTGFTVAGRTAMAPARGWMVAVFIGAIAASMLTPAGPAGLLYPLRYVEPGDWGLAHIPEWQSPNFHEVAHWPLMVLVVVVGATTRRTSPGWLTLLAWIGIAGSLLSLRTAPVAAVLALPSLAFGLDAWLAHRPPRAAQHPLTRRWLEIGLAAAVVVTAVVAVLPPDLEANAQATIDDRYPVAATAWLDEHEPTAHVYNHYGWGGWLIWNLTEAGLRNFVDGRNDMFSQQILDDYTAVLEADPGWESILAAYGATAILVRPDARLVHGPAQLAGWCEVTRDQVAVLLLPNCPD